MSTVLKSPRSETGADTGSLVGLDLAALGIPSLDQYVDAYATRTGLDPRAHLSVYLAYNFFRLAAIVQVDINGDERVVVSQIQRPPGVSFEEETHPTGKSIYYGRVIPSRGAWFEIKYDLNDVLIAYVDRRRNFPAQAGWSRPAAPWPARWSGSWPI